MSLIKECQICGSRISFRKMPHGKYVAFDVKTNNRHIHSKSEISKIKKIKDKEIDKNNKLKENTNKKSKQDKKTIFNDFSNSEEFDAYVSDSNEDIYKDDTLSSLRDEIDGRKPENKNNKSLIFGLVVIIVILIFLLNN